MSRVFLHIPHSGNLAPEVLESLTQPPTLGDHEIQMSASGMSLLAMNFNGGWAAALNSKVDYFCMHHSDIGVGPDAGGWLDYMIDELHRTDADVLSCVVPIKDTRGLTSTGLLRRVNGKHEHRRIQMKELDALPDTFDADDVCRLFSEDLPILPDDEPRILTVNTGLWVCRFDRPWRREVCFHIKDAILENEDGTFTAHTWPEDWNFSEWCYDRGLKVVANRKVPVVHRGGTVYSNQARWGKEHDDWNAQRAGDL